MTLFAAGCAHLPSKQLAETSSSEPVVDIDFDANGLQFYPYTLPDVIEPDAPEAPGDLWARIRSGLQMEPRDDPRVEAELAAYARSSDYMARVADRAEPYLHYIVEELERRGMPTEIALLPVVESAYRPFAYSSGRAAGLWQFIPSTGLHYGLKQTWWYDGRRDIVASTHAALDYLERLHGLFSDWELALAAYNAGEGTVGRAIRANRSRGLPTDYWNLPLSRETQAYVPRLLAIRALVADPARYNLDLRSIPDEPYLTVVEVGTQIDLALAAELADISVDDLYQLNPGFNRWATDPDGPHLLVVPIASASRFESALSELPPQRRVKWHRYQIARGDSLISIANRHHTTVEVLRQVNELQDNTIRAGQHLIVPMASKSAEHYTQSASQRLAQVQSRQRPGQKRMHTVKQGDTLWGIARSYGVSTDQLTAWNGLSARDTLQPGQSLAIWTSSPSAGPRPASNPQLAKAPAFRTNPAAQIQKVRYTVRAGDSLYAIAQRFNVTIDDLRRWNDLSAKRYLQPGQLLIMHVDVTGGSI
jgi:membrane-bound lytic murein transglycosylase D